MKKTLSLIGLLVIGLSLVLSPALGLLSGQATDATTLAIDAATTTPPVTVQHDPATTSTESDEPAATTTTASITTTTTTSAGPSIVSGPSVNTRFGAFQVEITVAGGEVIDIVTLQQPGDRHSRSINARAIPAYEAAALDAQSADIDVISGATITWRAYTSSLQAALDQAGLS